MIRGMKYNQFQVFPEASLLCGRQGVKTDEHWVGAGRTWQVGVGVPVLLGLCFPNVLDLWSSGALAAQRGKRSIESTSGGNLEVPLEGQRPS